jgi:hypothetical protein
MKNSFAVIKVVLAILLLLSLLEMPYGFYQIVRLVAMIGFGILAYDANTNGKKNEVIFFVGLALLFQPFIKVALGREIWIIVDLIVGVFLIASVFNDLRKSDCI